MPAITVQFASPAVTRSGNSIFVNFADGSQREFDGPTGLQDWAAQNKPDTSAVMAMAIANRLAADPLLDDPALWDGKKITVDIEQAIPNQVFKVQ